MTLPPVQRLGITPSARGTGPLRMFAWIKGPTNRGLDWEHKDIAQISMAAVNKLCITPTL
jgi:hypothetical protein